MYAILVTTHIILTLMSMIFIAIMLSERGNDTSKYLLAASLSNFLIILGYTEEILGESEQFVLFSIKVQLIGMIYLITFILFFIARCCRITIHQEIRFAILVVDMLFIFLAVSAEYHSLYFADYRVADDGLYPYMIFKDGIVSNISMAFTFLQIAAIVVFTIIDARRKKKTKSTPMLFILLCFLPPLVAHILYRTLGIGRMGFNPVPASISIGILYLIFMVYRFRLLDATDIAKESIVESLNDIYFVVDISKNLLFGSKTAYELLPGLKDRKSSGGLIQTIFDYNQKDIEIAGRQYRVSVSSFYDKKTLKGYSLWLIDKTAEVENTKRLIELKEEAEKANRAKSIFLANMSHEIRTPLNAIMGSTEILMRSEQTPETRELATDIRAAGNVLNGLIGGILDFSKIESGQIDSVEENYDLGLSVKRIIKLFSDRIAEKGLAFPVQVDPALPKGLRGDCRHIRQVLVNLLDNAIKYTQSGFVSLTLTGEDVEGKEKLIFVVEDSGCGIKESAIPHLFDSFSRSDLRRNMEIQGTGLGLAIAKRLVESMGGEISVESTYGRGSRFTFYVYQQIWDPAPLGDFEQIDPGKKQEEEKGEEFIAPKARILCVDDNSTNRKVTKELLNVYRIRVDLAESGEEALRMLRDGNRYQLILMDQMMPGIDGIETAEEIRKMSADIRRIPIIALTADAVVGARERFLEKGFQDYIAKPMELKEIERILVKYLPADYLIYLDREKNTEKRASFILPGVNAEDGLKRYGGDRIRYLKALRFICEDGGKQIKRMSEMADAGDLEGYGREAHSIKGLSLGIGAYALSEQAKEMEFLAFGKDMEEFEKKNQDFLRDYEHLVENIGYVLEENKVELSGQEKEAAGDELPLEELDLLLEKLQDALEMLDYTKALEIAEEILSHKLNERTRIIIFRIRDDINDFEFEKAFDRTQTLLGSG